MDGRAPNQPPANFEDQFRQMVLNSPSENTPRVRLPPPNYGPNYVQPQPIQPQYDGSPAYCAPAMPQYPRRGLPVQRRHIAPDPMQGPDQPPPQPLPHAMPPYIRPRGNAHLGAPQNMHQTNQLHYQQLHYRGRPGHARGAGRGGPGQRQQRQQQVQLDPNAFARGGRVQGQVRPHLFEPNAQLQDPNFTYNDQRELQNQYLQDTVQKVVPPVEMSQAERGSKETFQETLQKLCHELCEENPKLPKVQLECFGSFASGFASTGSDMDLALVVQDQSSTEAVFSMLEDDLPRSLEKKLLQAGHGARLLTRTRVPIIKVCQSPGASFLDKLVVERERWESLPIEKKYPHLYPEGDDDGEDAPQSTGGARVEAAVTSAAVQGVVADASIIETKDTVTKESTLREISTGTSETALETAHIVTTNTDTSNHVKQKRDYNNTWTRERKPGPLDFPKDGVGIQCDINFFNPLGLHNTQMLRCYSLCDPRVRPMVLFVKSWAKLRKINSSYSGTLSSYGFVLMVLHYLMNVARPPVIPNLQHSWRPDRRCTPRGANKVEVDGWDVDFWRNEDEIKSAFQMGQMSSNQESVGSLLVGFFQYFSAQMRGAQFRWTTEVLSLRTEGGILTKTSKGWVKATTEESGGKKVQYRYLFCIEDPFELAHNVARTVTHNGIVAIRDEFRRAYRILLHVGQGRPSQEGELFAELVEAEQPVETSDGLKPLEATADASKWRPDNSATKPILETKQDIAQRQKPTDRGQGKARADLPKQDAKAIDVGDQEAFPSLSAASAPRKRQKEKDMSSIDGKKAQAYLEEYRRKKAEAEAEQTANQSAEWVLHD
ncbi:Poly(A) RNA polymerase cid1 [Lecanosticta acicola]|uniref:polynucleotide adenylyltransferase n=1 Tax=Lecanosticta acicola TaxID=111012 RepID=A0AAI9EFB6_9PEZI|nr:Poly(A) RNA polymerase cid1 [Lecanosticta acicola]